MRESFRPLRCSDVISKNLEIEEDFFTYTQYVCVYAHVNHTFAYEYFELRVSSIEREKETRFSDQIYGYRVGFPKK